MGGLLITGGTGTIGQAIVREILTNPVYDTEREINRVVIYSRDEQKQEQMYERFKNLDDQYGKSKLRFFIGDVRDKDRLKTAMSYDITHVIHTAALKIVPIAEYNPFEVVKTNIMGTQNLIDVCQDLSVPVKRMIAISTDKAVYPVNLYGSTKLTMEKMVLAANNTTGRFKKHFGVVRYGNVAGSRGSVIHRFREQYQKNKKVKITNPAMTRFWISQRDAVDLVMNSLYDPYLGLERRLFIPDMSAYDIASLAKAVCGSMVKIEVVGSRIGEKLHETILTKEEKELYGFEVSETSYVAPKLSVRKLRALIKRDVDDLL